MNAHYFPCLCSGCKSTLGPDGVAASRRVARRHRDAEKRARASVVANNIAAYARAAETPDPSNCQQCGSEWGSVCPCTDEGLARLLA